MKNVFRKLTKFFVVAVVLCGIVALAGYLRIIYAYGPKPVTYNNGKIVPTALAEKYLWDQLQFENSVVTMRDPFKDLKWETAKFFPPYSKIDLTDFSEKKCEELIDGSFCEGTDFDTLNSVVLFDGSKVVVAAYLWGIYDTVDRFPDYCLKRGLKLQFTWTKDNPAICSK